MKLVKFKPEDLDFDRQNPRLAEFGITDSEEELRIIDILWESMDVEELALSILASGYLPNEPLIVAEENGKNVVIEGNRRLAAIRLLANPLIAKELGITRIDTPTPEVLGSMKKIPCYVTTREQAWQYLGFKHVNGPARWGSYAKAKYISQVHNEYGVPLEKIARQIGDTHRTAQRLYRGLMVLEQAEKVGAWSLEDRAKSHFSFSHLYTGLQYDGFSDFLDLSPEADERVDPVPKDKYGNLQELMVWLYGSRKQEVQPIIKSQNPDLSNLETVVKNRESLAALRAGSSLRESIEIGRPAEALFQDELLAAKRSLQKCRASLTEGYDGSEDLLRTAGTVYSLAEDLYDDMEKKRGKKRKILTES